MGSRDMPLCRSRKKDNCGVPRKQHRTDKPNLLQKVKHFVSGKHTYTSPTRHLIYHQPFTRNKQ